MSWISIKEFAARISRPWPTVYKWARNGYLKKKGIDLLYSDSGRSRWQVRIPDGNTETFEVEPIGQTFKHAQMRARALVARRVQSGKMPKPSSLLCTDCGGQACHYDHYKGYYEFALDVQPVCPSCHQKREFKRGVIKLNHSHPSFIAGRKRAWEERRKRA